jgi:hypothetical protein
LCGVHLHDPTQEQKGLRFSIAFQDVQKIELTGLYNNTDIRDIIPAFRMSPQKALLSGDIDNNAESFKAVVRYLSKVQKVSYYFRYPSHIYTAFSLLCNPLY